MAFAVDALANLLPAAMNMASAAVDTPLPGAFSRLVQSLLVSPAGDEAAAATSDEAPLPEPASSTSTAGDPPVRGLLAAFAALPVFMPPAVSPWEAPSPCTGAPDAPAPGGQLVAPSAIVRLPASGPLDLPAVEPVRLPRPAVPVGAPQATAIVPDHAAVSSAAAAEAASPDGMLAGVAAHTATPRRSVETTTNGPAAPADPQLTSLPPDRPAVPRSAAPTAPVASDFAPTTGEAPPQPASGPPPGGAEPSFAGVVRFDGDAPHEKPRAAGAPVFAPPVRSSRPTDAPVTAAPASLADTLSAAPDNASLTAAAPIRQPDLPPAVHQLGRVVLEKAADGGGEARIRLDPPELGSVTLHVRLHGDAVQVDVHVERPEALHLLREHTPDLSNLLGQHGLDLAGLSVGLGARDDAGTDAGQGQFPAFARRLAPSDLAAAHGLDASGPTLARALVGTAANPDGQHLYRV
ncbi:MAG: flagellar hook-length control protein FliK [Dehalococcoidia bacterium]|nr:flagellar hook-length control protein FliK [Dehalococcoidia bacterium]